MNQETLEKTISELSNIIQNIQEKTNSKKEIFGKEVVDRLEKKVL